MTRARGWDNDETIEIDWSYEKLFWLSERNAIWTSVCVDSMKSARQNAKLREWHFLGIKTNPDRSLEMLNLVGEHGDTWVCLSQKSQFIFFWPFQPISVLLQREKKRWMVSKCFSGRKMLPGHFSDARTAIVIAENEFQYSGRSSLMAFW